MKRGTTDTSEVVFGDTAAASRKMVINVEKIRGEWKVVFGFGNQSFELAYGGTKSEANWMAKMLRICFKNYRKSI